MPHLLNSALVMKHGSKLVEQVFEELNASKKVLTPEEFAEILEKNKNKSIKEDLKN